MKKLFLGVFLLSVLAIAGCASDSSNSTAQTQVPETVTTPDVNNHATLVGKYKVDYFAIVDGGNSNAMLSSDCAYATKNDFSDYTTCYDATILADLVDVQQNNENGMQIMSFIIQMQLDGTEIRTSLKEHAYHHLLFPIQNQFIPVSGELFATKATERGLTSFFIPRPGGDANNRNATLHYLRNTGDQIEIKLLYEKDPAKIMQYIYRISKISDTPGGYVQTQGGIQQGLYAISTVFNTLIESVFEDTDLNDIFAGFKNDFPNQTGEEVTTTQPE